MAADAETLALQAGLQIAWRDHPDDVRDAIAHARKLAGAFTRPADPAAEPTPPYAAPASVPRASKKGGKIGRAHV